jgi:long-chain-fatty-acid--CoA ligase ACSBG
MAAFVTLKCEVDPKTGLPSKNLAPEAINYLKAETGLTFKTTEEAIVDPKVNEIVKKCIELTNKKSVSRAAHIRKFKLLPVDFSIPGGELTPTLKLKRKVTETKYKQFVDEMFAADAKL